jgi:hypothetical protein
MSGTTGDIIPIVIVPTAALVFMLGMIFYASSHPRWGSQAPAGSVSTHGVEGSVPSQRLSSPGPVVPGQRAGTAADEGTLEQARASETRRE